jgi:hypothetical protein
MTNLEVFQLLDELQHRARARGLGLSPPAAGLALYRSYAQWGALPDPEPESREAMEQLERWVVDGIEQEVREDGWHAVVRDSTTGRLLDSATLASRAEAMAWAISRGSTLGVYIHVYEMRGGALLSHERVSSPGSRA